MSEQFYKEFFEEALNQIKEDLGNDKEFRLWYNIAYVGESDDTITVAVQSDVMWKLMNKNGIVEKIQQKLAEFIGSEIKLAPAPRQSSKKIAKKTESSQEPSIMGVPAKELFSETTKTPKSTISEDKKTEKKSELPKGDSRFSRAMQGLQSMMEEKRREEMRQNPLNQKMSAVPSQKELAKITTDYDEFYAEQLRKAQNAGTQQQSSEPPKLKKEYTFENFIPDNNLMLAYNAAKRAATEPGIEEYNPILFYGGVGLGKTHLMQAIGNEIYARNPRAKICYISAEDFTNEFLSALDKKTTEKFKKKYRSLDVLLLDDIQFLEGKEATQEELFHTFNAIYDKKGQLVFTSDRPLAEIKGFTQRLRTRFGRGLDYDLQLPDFETRCVILTRKINGSGKEIPKEVVEFIAQNIQSNIRELESCAFKITAYCELAGEELSLKVAKELLKSKISETEFEGALSVEAIQQAVAKYYGIKISDITGKKKTKQMVLPRQIAIYLSRKCLDEYSLQDIGREFGGKDHSTIINAVNKIENEIKANPTIASTVRFLEKEAYKYV